MKLPYIQFRNNFGCTVGNQSKVIKTMSFYLICRIYVQLTHLALPSKLCYAFFILHFNLLFYIHLGINCSYLQEHILF